MKKLRSLLSGLGQCLTSGNSRNHQAQDASHDHGVHVRSGDTDSGPLALNSPGQHFPDGVEILHDCHDAHVDICFVHGLTGNRNSTWTANGQPAPWPKTLLPPRLSKARIITYGYDAYIVRKSVASINGLTDHAKNLLNDVTTNRAGSNASSSRPLIFVAHSLGGLICKEAILLSRNNPSRISGVGAWMADWAKIPASTLGIVKSTNKSLLKVLETDDKYLQSVQDRFWSMIREQQQAGRDIEITCFFEELPLAVVGEVVPKASATLESYNAISIHANHSDMVKFASADDNGFKRLLGELVRWELQVRKSATRQVSRSTKEAQIEKPASSSFIQQGPGDMVIAPGGKATKSNFSGASFRGPVSFGNS